MTAEEIEIFQEHIDRVVNSSARARQLAKEMAALETEE
jgi:hypothetical protein